MAEDAAMIRRKLGQTGLEIGVLGLGTTKFGRRDQVRYPADFELPGDRDIEELLDIARAAGVNFIDTAPAYGEAEERLGKLLRGSDDWVVATKAGEEFENGQSRFDFSPAAIRASVERSRRRLRRDRIDLVLLHSDGNDVDIILRSGALNALYELKHEGLIAAVGVSTKTVSGGLLAVAVCDVVMVTVNDGYRNEVPVVRAANRSGKGVLVKKPLDSGHRSDPSASLAAVLAEPGVTCAVTGTIDPDHLRQNCTVAEQVILPADP
jgi:aryl-alcohol dehydrogenase-like predicted oxidoreductase